MSNKSSTTSTSPYANNAGHGGRPGFTREPNLSQTPSSPGSSLRDFISTASPSQPAASRPTAEVSGLAGHGSRPQEALDGNAIYVDGPGGGVSVRDVLPEAEEREKCRMVGDRKGNGGFAGRNQ